MEAVISCGIRLPEDTTLRFRDASALNHWAFPNSPVALPLTPGGNLRDEPRYHLNDVPTNLQAATSLSSCFKGAFFNPHAIATLLCLKPVHIAYTGLHKTSIHTMAPRKRRQRASPRATRTKRPNISKSPNPPSPSLHPAPSSIGLQASADIQPRSQIQSANHASPPMELSNTATTYQTRMTLSGEEAAAQNTDALDRMATSSPFIDWLETHVQSYDTKQRASEQPQLSKPGPGEFLADDTKSRLEAHFDANNRSDSGSVRSTIESNFGRISPAAQLTERNEEMQITTGGRSISDDQVAQKNRKSIGS